MANQTGPQRVVGLAILAVVIITAASGVMLWELRKREVRHAVVETESVARLLATNVDEAVKGVDIILGDTRDKLQSVAGIGSKLASHDVQMELTGRLINAPEIRTLFVVDPQGIVVNSSRGDAGLGVSVADQAYFKAFQKSPAPDAYFGGLTLGHISKRWKVFLARSFNDASGARAGLVVAAMDSTYFERLFGLMQLDIDRRLALYLEDGALFASHPLDQKWLGKVPPEMMAPGRLAHSAEQVKVFPFVDEDGAAYTFAVVRAEHFPLMVGVGNNDQVTQAEWRSYAEPIALGGMLVSGAIILAGLVLYRRQRIEERLSEALNEASRRARAMVDAMMDAIVTVDDQLRIIVFNPAAERMFGWRASEMLGQPLDLLLPDEMRHVHGMRMSEFVNSDEERRAMSPSVQVLGRRRDGTLFPADSTISRSTVDGQRQLTAALRDVTERVRAKARLQEANEQLRKLADALQDVREAERLRIARELHDDLGQRLTGLKLDLSWLSDKLKKEGSGLARDVDVTRAHLDTAMDGARRIWTELRPVMVEDLGFGDAVDAMVRETERRGGLDITTQMPARAMVGKGPVATALFRVVQEALHNIVRHAGAMRVQIRLVVVEDDLVLTVLDDGAGFDPASRVGKGMGLVSMRERVHGLEGEFEIESSPGRATRIKVTLPLSVLARDESIEHDEEAT
jgi:PAS domain S-box-containing protein